MSIQTLAVIKSYFEKKDKPTQQEFVDLIDTLSQYFGVNQIIGWTAIVYPVNSIVSYYGKDYVSIAATLSTDIPGASSKWTERLSGYLDPALSTPTPLVQWKHTNGDSEYVGDSRYDQNGLGLYVPAQVSGYSFNTIELKAARQSSTGLVYIKIYESSGIEGTPDTSFTLLRELTDTWDTDIDKFKKIRLTTKVNVTFGKILLILFSTKTSQKVSVKRWTNNTPGNRLGFNYSLSTNYTTIFNETWVASSLTTHSVVPVILSLEYPYYNIPRITIPSNVVAIVGVTTALYYDALILAGDKGLESPIGCTVEVYCTKGKIEERAWVYTPVVGDIGTTSLTVKVYSDTGVKITEKTVTLETIASAAPAAVKNIVNIGDSLVGNGTITTILRDNFVLLGSNTPVFWGTLGTGSNKHEGHGGWTFGSFTSSMSGTNPLYSGGALNIAAYRTTLGMGSDKFDVVTLQLGINESLYSTFSEETLSANITYAKAICAAFLADNSTTKIIVMLPSSCGNTKGGWGENYGAAGFKEEYRRNIHRLRELIITNFDLSAYSANVSVGIVGLVIDRYYGYDRTTKSISSRIASTEETHTNAVHPGTDGYEQIGDGYFAQVKKLVG